MALLKLSEILNAALEPQIRKDLLPEFPRKGAAIVLNNDMPSELTQIHIIPLVFVLLLLHHHPTIHFKWCLILLIILSDAQIVADR